MSTQERLFHYRNLRPGAVLTTRQAKRMRKKANKNPVIDTQWDETLTRKVRTTTGVEGFSATPGEVGR